MKKITFLVATLSYLLFTSLASTAQSTWTARSSSAPGSQWRSVIYANGKFVAVGSNIVMTSPDGITWTTRTAAANNNWNSVTYGNSLFVAVSNSGTGNRVMTSPDGITWTSRTSAANNYWTSVTYGNGKFVAVSNTGSGTGDRIMTSLDGITWTSSSGLPDGAWESIVYGNNKFVAISSGSVISSTDGIAWITDPTNLPVKSWKSITYGNGLFVAVCFDTTSNYCVVTSPDGITWTPQFSAANNWSSVTYGNSLFVAISRGGGSTTNVVVTSPDGINWTGRTVPAQLNMTFMFGVCYGNNLFVGVGANMMGNDIMTSPYDATLASANFDFSLQLSVFPNPFTEQFVISSEKEATVEIFNVIGKQIGNQKINLGENVVDLSSHPAGMYFVKLTTENGSKTIKMIKN